MFFGFTECCQAVCSFSGLADNDHQAVRIQDRVSVAEFGCQLHTYRDSGQVLDYILGCHSHMIGRTTGYDIDLADLLDVLICKAHL